MLNPYRLPASGMEYASSMALPNQPSRLARIASVLLSLLVLGVVVWVRWRAETHHAPPLVEQPEMELVCKDVTVTFHDVTGAPIGSTVKKECRSVPVGRDR